MKLSDNKRDFIQVEPKTVVTLTEDRLQFKLIKFSSMTIILTKRNNKVVSTEEESFTFY